MNDIPKLLTVELEQRFAQVGRQEGIGDPLVICHFFIPHTAASWYILEYDPKTRRFFGWTSLYGTNDSWELGYIDQDALQSLEIYRRMEELVLYVHRDLNFTEKPISQVEDLPPRCAGLHAEAARCHAAD